ncbi:hypothetical protein AB4Y40_22930 [Paraburkholderia sp. EG287B]|uniref:hypothetical protein n=1 Tax=Paraburkholderia sp. EG287B TaxID=3237010 RepID=UPI0034D22323
MASRYERQGRSRFRTIQVRMWGDEKFKRLSPIPPCGQGLWVYLLTGHHTGPIPGLFHTGPAAMAEQLHWSLEDFAKAFDEVLQQGMAQVDLDACVVWIPKAVEYNKPQSPNVVLSWANEWDLMPECALKWEARETLRAFIGGLGKGYPKAFAQVFDNHSPEALPKASGKTTCNQEQEQEQEQKDSKESLKHIRPARADGAARDLLGDEHGSANGTARHVGIAEVRKVFGYWQTVMHSPRSRLDDKRERKIRIALRDFTPEELQTAIRGCSKDPWHMGTNHSGRAFNSIELILRDSQHIEKFISYDSKPALPVKPSGPVARQERRARTAKAFGLVTSEGVVDVPPEDCHDITRH